MTGNIQFLHFLLWITRAGAGLLALIAGSLMIVSILALFGFLPKNMKATYEVPVKLQNVQEFYKTQSMDQNYSFSHFEVTKANLEALPVNPKVPQFIAFLGASVFLGLFLGILIFLSKILSSFVEKRPFISSNAIRVRWIGLLTIGIAIYEFLIHGLVLMVFQDKFLVSNAIIPSFPEFWEINFAALFLGLVIIAFSEAFRTGTQLQQLEELTV